MSPALGLWSPAPENIKLSNEQVHLWRFRLDLPPTEIVKMKHLLSDDERSRADRLIDPLKASQFMVARGRLRLILAQYTDLMPHHIRFSYGEHGKPVLTKNAALQLTFNISHAGEWGLLAVTKESEIGVDIETIDQKIDYEKIAADFFSTTEIDDLEQYSPKRRRRAFYRIWTRKEASLKMTGSGFSSPQMSNQNIEGQIKAFVVDRGCLGAVSVEGTVTVVQRWHLN